jgi:hypothetical protein
MAPKVGLYRGLANKVRRRNEEQDQFWSEKTLQEDTVWQSKKKKHSP